MQYGGRHFFLVYTLGRPYIFDNMLAALTTFLKISTYMYLTEL